MKFAFITAAFAALLILFSACSPGETAVPAAEVPTAAEEYTPPALDNNDEDEDENDEPESPEPSDDQLGVITVNDQAGREVVIEGEVVNLISSFHISSVAAVTLGLGDRFVGVENRADERPFFTLAAPNLINLPSLGTAANFNMEAALDLDPDLILLPARQRDTADILAELGVPVILVEPENLDLLLEMMTIIATATGVPERAEALIAFYEESIAEMRRMTEGLTDRPVVYFTGTGSHLTTAPREMYQSSLIDLAGGMNAAIDIEGNGWVQISYEQLLEMNPDVIVLPSEAGFTVEYLLSNPQLALVSAVQNNRVYHMPNVFGAWDIPSTSFTLGARWLLSVLHGDIYSIEEMREYAEAFFAEFLDVSIDSSLIEER